MKVKQLEREVTFIQSDLYKRFYCHYIIMGKVHDTCTLYSDLVILSIADYIRCSRG